MARKLKIQAQQTKTISEAFSDFLLCKKALGVSDKTLKTYSQHFSAICKFLDSSALIGGLFKRPLEEMIEQMRSAHGQAGISRSRDQSWPDEGIHAGHRNLSADQRRKLLLL